MLGFTMDKKRIKKVLMAFPGGKALIRSRASILAHRQLAQRYPQMDDAKEVFRHHYESNGWGNAESVSGPGSTLQYTENIRKMLPRLAEELGIQVILDAPCGDYNWFRMIEWNARITYIGGDIVQPLVEHNRALYGTDNTMFKRLDVVNDVLPRADLWLCRDCLFHLSERDIFLVFDNFLKSNIAYMLTSTHPGCDLNTDIPTGWARPINLQLPPFSLGNPIRVIDDWIEGYPVRYLALWERGAVKDALASNKEFHRTIKCRR